MGNSQTLRKRNKLPHTILIITLNVNVLNPPIKVHRLVSQIKRQDPTICCLEKMHLNNKDKHIFWLFYVFFLHAFFIDVLDVHCGIYKSSYNISNILHLIQSPSYFSFTLPTPITGIVSTGPFFHLHTCV
jgi:hypothetical protein